MGAQKVDFILVYLTAESLKLTEKYKSGFSWGFARSHLLEQMKKDGYIPVLKYRDFYFPIIKGVLLPKYQRYRVGFRDAKDLNTQHAVPLGSLMYVATLEPRRANEPAFISIQGGRDLGAQTFIQFYRHLERAYPEYIESIMGNPEFEEVRRALTLPKFTDPRASTGGTIPVSSYASSTMTTTATFPDPAMTTAYQQTSTTSKGTTQTMLSEKEMQDILRELTEAIKDMRQVQKPSALEEKLLEAVLARTTEIATAELEADLKGRLDEFIRSTYGALPTVHEIKIADIPAITTQGLFHTKFKDILTMVANGIPVMLTGAAGVGKNYTVEQVAQAMNVEFYYTGSVTQEYKLTGFIDAGGRFHETEFYKAFKDGGIFMLDEVDASSPETLVLLNAAIANRYFDFPTGRIHAHENFRVVCAGNTFGTGADMIYVGRNVLDGATLDRFALIKMDYDVTVEKQLCPDEEFHKFVLDMRKTVNEYKLRHIVGMRASINGFKALQAGMSKAFVVESIVLKGLSLDDLAVIVKNFPSTNSVWFSEVKSYYRSLGGSR